MPTKEQYARYGEREKTLVRQTQTRWRERMWDEFFEHYGSACACCGETEKAFLTIEHADIKRVYTGPSEIARLKRMGWPDGVTVLCFNCNCRRGGPCPHTVTR